MKLKLFNSILALVSLFMTTSLAQNKTVGIVTSVKGSAKIQEPGAKAPRIVEAADPITEGTRITVGESGSVSFLFCPESFAAQVGAGADVTFTAKAASVNKGVVSQKHNVPYCRIPAMESVNAEHGPGSKDHVGGTGIRGDSSLVLLSPVRTHVELTGVTLSWNPTMGASSYLLQIKSEKGDVVWEGEVKDSKIVLPDSLQLQPDTLHRWRVTAKSGEDVLGDASTWFKTLSAIDQMRLDKIVSAFSSTPAQDEWTKHFMLGSLYEELDMKERASREYGQIHSAVKINNRKF